MRSGNPRARRRLGLVFTVVGACVGALATGMRSGLLDGGRDGTGSYLVDVAAVGLCVAGVAIEARAIAVMADFFPGLRREAIVQALGGGLLSVTACLVIPALRSPELPAWGATTLALLVYLGAGRALSGAAGVAVTVAPGYLERRIDERIDEPW